jgi:hypothetical protein
MVVTVIVSAIIFGTLTFFWFPYMATDIPQRYGVPFVFREVGCGMIRGSCVNQFNVINLLLDIGIVVVPVYGIVFLTTRRRGTP